MPTDSQDIIIDLAGQGVSLYKTCRRPAQTSWWGWGWGGDSRPNLTPSPPRGNKDKRIIMTYSGQCPGVFTLPPPPPPEGN